ncbi:hypothetical protein BVX97_06595 [bacterium E08(2017)]|nr:hypothetical protein BVX97_06595 [bacterium E08(2017)]
MKVTIDGEVLPDAAIEYELSRLLQFYAQHMDEAEVRSQIDVLKSRAVDQAIGAKLLIQEAARMDIAVTEDEVEQSFNAMVEGNGGMATFKGLLAQQGLDEDAVSKSITTKIEIDILNLIDI